MGEWIETVIDDYFPCISKERGPAFTKSAGNEIWVLILEKAWAKIYGSFERIEAGITRECLHDLTGAPTRVIFMDDTTLWDEICVADRKNWIMTTGAGDQGQGADVMNSVGLIGSHAYSLISANEVQTTRGREQLVKLRNPWGEGEWNGEYSDNSPLWTPELK